jgi:hypothetical protein
MADDGIEAMAVHFKGVQPDTGEMVSIGTLLMHPCGDAMVMGPEPDREISTAVILRCMEAAHAVCRRLSDDAPQEEKVLRYAVRAVLYQLLERIGPPDAGNDNGTLQ